jgi:hypothetical protein
VTQPHHTAAWTRAAHALPHPHPLLEGAVCAVDGACAGSIACCSQHARLPALRVARSPWGARHPTRRGCAHVRHDDHIMLGACGSLPAPMDAPSDAPTPKPHITRCAQSLAVVMLPAQPLRPRAVVCVGCVRRRCEPAGRCAVNQVSAAASDTNSDAVGDDGRCQSLWRPVVSKQA